MIELRERAHVQLSALRCDSSVAAHEELTVYLPFTYLKTEVLVLDQCPGLL